MYCTKCGAVLSQNGRFCEKCGAAISSTNNQPIAESQKSSNPQAVKPYANNKLYYPKEMYNDGKGLSILSYIGIFWIFGLISHTGKVNPKVRFHIWQGIALTIFSFVLNLLGTIITSSISNTMSTKMRVGSYTYSVPTTAASILTIIIDLAIVIIMLVFVIKGIINASRNTEKPLPIFGKLAAKRASNILNIMNSAYHGDVNAQYHFGYYYFFNVQDIDYAIYWLCLSELNNNNQATILLQKMIETGVPRIHERISATKADIFNYQHK